VYVATLPTENDTDCQEVDYDGETLYVCNGTLYRPALLNDSVVYEIVSEPDEVIDPDGETITKVAPEPTLEATGDLRLTTPRMKGERVRQLQEALAALGYNVGTKDGIFGPAADNVVRKYQANVGLEVTGVVDQATTNALGL
jgi:peptidoglycan hydrolase-like protein with peptidoglycan-binding domain